MENSWDDHEKNGMNESICIYIYISYWIFITINLLNIENIDDYCKEWTKIWEYEVLTDTSN